MVKAVSIILIILNVSLLSQKPTSEVNTNYTYISAPTGFDFPIDIGVVKADNNYTLNKDIDYFIKDINNTIYLENKTYNLKDLNITTGTKYIGDNTTIITNDYYITNLNGNLYFENITFDGGVMVYNSTENKTSFIGKNLKFINSVGNGFASRGNVFSYLENCIAENNLYDGFNYHGVNSYSPYGIENNCIGRFNGGNTSGLINANNGSTLHEDCKLIRIGCEYYNNVGNNVHDINNSKSWNINCISYDSDAKDSNFNGDFTVWDNAIMWNLSCKTIDKSVYNSQIIKNAHIYNKNCEGFNIVKGTIETYI